MPKPFNWAVSRTQKPIGSKTRSFYRLVTMGFPLTPFPAFTPQSLCTEQLFNTEAFTQSTFYASLYTEQLLRANAFTHRRWYTEQPSPTDTFTHRSQLLHTDDFARSSFYTKTLLHGEADRVQTGLKITGPRAHPSAGPGRIGDNGENKQKKWKANWSLSSF